MPVDAKIPAADGFELTTTFYAGPPEWIIISSAMGVPRSFYSPIAEFFSKQGLSVVTYDYRGIGDSMKGPPREFKGRMRDWGMLDMAGVVQFAQSRMARRLYLLGHGAGGQLAGLMDRPRLDAFATVSAYNGYWGNQPGDAKYGAWIRANISIPLFSALNGFVRWTSVTGHKSHIPASIMVDLAKWTKDQAFIMGDDSLPLTRYQSFGAPILSHSVADDPAAGMEAVDLMMNAYSRVQRKHLEPNKYGLQKIGPAGFFLPECATLWPELLAWFRNPTPAKRTGTR